MQSPVRAIALIALVTSSCGNAGEEHPPEPAELPAPKVADKQPGDLAPCPGINPDIRRPAGSNCLGITPEECGASLAQQYVGRKGTPALRKEISELAVGSFRWIPYGTAVTDDLQAGRMNVSLDEDGTIAKVDCF